MIIVQLLPLSYVDMLEYEQYGIFVSLYIDESGIINLSLHQSSHSSCSYTQPFIYLSVH